ncbi:hypothetical protein PVK06_001811 [Gossypium arboreum]|uniref:Uncharacterized protein n=1 Tax=Gossypium arboreum TaxID=29729 RepID=A0ABR0R3C1_GOSAR|nr:hypothetical protein PVK06_001811 [Gossypium arboreum]
MKYVFIGGTLLRSCPKNPPNITYFAVQEEEISKRYFSEDLLGNRARAWEVSNLLDMLRSTCIDDRNVSKSSETSHGEWKLKHDNEEFRVMYREGPHGTAFHTLLVEGYVDGDEDSNSFAREANHNKEVTVSPLPNVLKPFETNQVALSSYRNGTVEVNGFHENGLTEVKKLSNRRKHRLGCFGFNSG